MKKTKRKPTPAQIRARKAFARMAKERARQARIKKRLTTKTTQRRKAATKKRNTTIIRAKRVKVVSANPESWRKVLMQRLREARAKATTREEKQSIERQIKSLKQGDIKRKQLKRNPSKVIRQKRERFTGKKSTKTLSLVAPTGAPSQLAILGRLKAIKTRGKVLSVPRSKNPNGNGVYLAEDAGGNLHIIGDPLPVLSEKGRDLGPITEIEYIAQKPHLGYPDTTEFFHEFGERGGEKPHLVTDAEGALWIEGGDYFITERGVENPSRRKRRGTRKRRR